MDIYASDEEKAEEIKRWWRENGRSVMIGLIIGFASIFAVRYWMNYQQNQTVQASLVYQQLLTALSDGDLEQAETSTDGLMKEYGSAGYSVFAALQLASETKDSSKAQTYLQWVMHNAKLPAHQELARLRLARLQADEGNSQAALDLIAAANLSAYQSLFAELEGDIYAQQGDKAAALAAYHRALTTVVVGDSRQSVLQMKVDNVAVANAG